MNNMRSLLIIFGVLCTNVYAINDCVPNTFTTLSYLINKPVKNDTWMKLFFAPPYRENYSPSITTTISNWNKYVPSVGLKVVFSGYEHIGSKGKYSLNIEPGVPYLWIGYPSKETTTSLNPDEVHTALVYFYKDSVVLINTVNTRVINNKPAFDFYIENITIDQLINRTIYIYKLTSPTPLTLNLITSLMPVQ